MYTSVHACLLHFALYSSDHLRSQDLNVILSECWEAKNKWMNIGLALTLENSDLETIRDSCRENAEDCFREMLSRWLRSDRPTLANLIAALREPTVGYQQLAAKLEREGIGNHSSAADSSLSEYSKVVIKFWPLTASLLLVAILFGVYLTSADYCMYCDATGKGLEYAVVGERAYVAKLTVEKGRPC